MCKVSILIPIYNVEKYLRQCLDSVVNQTLKDIEIICINDGSTDSSLSIINEFAEKDSRIKVIDKHNTGYGHSMNRGLKLARGEYIGIVESDDFADLNMFEVLYNTAKNVDAEIVKSNHWSLVNDKSIFNEYLNPPYNQVISPKLDNPHLLNCFPNIWSGIYKRAFLLANDIYFNETPGASYQDISFNFKILSCAEKVYLIKDAFLHYRRDNPNASVKSKYKAYCIFDEFNEVKNFLSKHKELISPCAGSFAVYKYKDFESNFRRIDDKFILGFIERIYKEFEQDNSSGYLNKIYWEEDKWQEVQLLLSNKEKFFYRQYEKLQRNRAYSFGFLSKIKTYDNIYLYGAGKAAANILFRLYQRNIKVAGALVSDMNNNLDKLVDIPVVAIENANIDKEQDVILISLKEENQYDVLYKLKANGFRNVILLTRELRRALI